MGAQIPGVQEARSLRFHEKGIGVIGGVIYQIRRHRKRPYHDRLLILEELRIDMAKPPGPEERSRLENLGRCSAHEHPGSGLGKRKKTIVILMRMRKENPEQRLIRRHQPGNSWDKVRAWIDVE